MTDDARRDREGIALAVLIGVFVALAILLVAVVATRGTGGSSAADTTTSTVPPTTTTLPPTTTTTTTTTLPPTTTTTSTVPPTTTTEPPFTGNTDVKTCTASGGDPGRVTAVRFAQRNGFTRVVFEFFGGVPGCWVGYTDVDTLGVLVYPVDVSNAYDPAIFDWSGLLQVGTLSVDRVSAGGMAGGSGEWQFAIDVAGTRPFRVFTLESPSRVVVDIED